MYSSIRTTLIYNIVQYSFPLMMFDYMVLRSRTYVLICEILEYTNNENSLKQKKSKLHNSLEIYLGNFKNGKL
jgi:hypothetical protein